MILVELTSLRNSIHTKLLGRYSFHNLYLKVHVQNSLTIGNKCQKIKIERFISFIPDINIVLEQSKKGYKKDAKTNIYGEIYFEVPIPQKSNFTIFQKIKS